MSVMSIHIKCLPHLSGLPNVHEEDMPKDAFHQQVVDCYVPAFEITLFSNWRTLLFPISGSLIRFYILPAILPALLIQYNDITIVWRD